MCEKNIFVLETYSSLSINHDAKMCRKKKKEVLIVTLLKPLCRLVNLQDY
jgi:hypothetical protein